MKPPSIGYLLPDVKLGGSERHVLRLASGLRKRGYEARIACIFREGSLAKEIRDEGIPLTCLNTPGDWGPLTFLPIFKWFRSSPVDILHTYLFGFHFFAGLPARLAKVPVILSSRRGREITHWQRRGRRWLENLGNLFVDRVVCCSKESAQWTLEHEKIQRERVVTIHNGIDETGLPLSSLPSEIRQRLGIPSKASVVGTVANFSPEKGYPHLLEAAARILRARPDTWFLWVGDGPLSGTIKKKAEEIPGHEKIIFTGYRSDIAGLMSAMDVFVLASVIEGFPNVLLEAMALARPVVATRVGGIPELIDSGEDGLLVPPKDGTALSQAVLSLLVDPGRARQMGIRAQEKVRTRFTTDQMVEQYEALYLSLWEGTPKTCAASSELFIQQ